MISRFPLRMAARELRASGRRLALFLASVSVGVAAIVAVEGFKANAIDSLEAQGRRLLGADLELQSRFPFSAEVEAVLDSVVRTGSAVARARSLPTMVASASTGRTALLAVRAIDPAFPFYGSIETEPAGSWPALEREGVALAEHAALVRLDLAPGDTVRIGGVELAVAALVRAVPGDPGIRSAVNPRLYVTHADLDRSELIQPGSLVGYRAYLSFPEEGDLGDFLRRHAPTLRGASVTWDTARERERDLARALDALGRFLGLAGLGALLLGGIG
ncbi:MAG: hypothetical protein R3266_08115, partial [Gemmatimonadota bacterium]|nr:hypothetical protein [Gemmatimonadota bacterium]